MVVSRKKKRAGNRLKWGSGFLRSIVCYAFSSTVPSLSSRIFCTRPITIANSSEKIVQLAVFRTMQAVHPFLFVLRDPALPPQQLTQLFQGSLLWIVCQCLICGCEPIDHSLDESFQNLFFRLEVVVERSFRYASLQDDGVHGCMDIALLQRLYFSFEPSYISNAWHLHLLFLL
ncbi:hypothetical protein AV540_01820 [Brevibacillus parabrevis]|nr:hypothetical protein AV540_01820 [Brevibacillus parabrevis]